MSKTVENNLENSKKKKISVGTIISAILCILLYILVIVELVYKFTGMPFYIFDTRADIVKTDSMSYVNKDDKRVQDFLEGHNDQIQPFDLVFSKKITENTPLDIYDIVIFNNPSVGTDLHRIVDKKVLSDTVSFEYISFDDTNKGFCFSKDVSYISTSVVKLNSFSLHGYSQTEYQGGFYLDYYSKAHDLTVKSVFLNDKNLYDITLTLTNDRSTKSGVSLFCDKEMNNFLISDITFNCSSGDIKLTYDNMTSGNATDLLFNTSESYLIRGDKANYQSDDGWYKRTEIYSKYSNKIPKMGYFFAYLSSIWGMIMIIGIAILITIVDTVLKKDKKKQIEETKSTPTAAPVAPIPTPKPVEPVKKLEPVVNLTVNTTTIKKDPTTGKEEVVKSSRVVQLKPGENKTVSNTVNLTSTQPTKPVSPAASIKKPVAPAPAAKPASTSAKPATPVSKSAPVPAKPVVSNGTVLRKSGSNIPPKGDKK